MNFEATIKAGLKSKIRQRAKSLLQAFNMPEKDKGKKKYCSFLNAPIKDTYIFYEAFAGLGILDNPRALFKAILSDPDFSNFTHVWSVDNLELAKENIEEFSSLTNVIIVKRESSEYYQYLATCKYLINNSTFGYYFVKRPEQIYINTWHGVPTKYMGYEHTIERVENARGPARNYLSADYLISANSFMTEVMYKRAYKLNNLFEGKILELGHPRSDSILNSNRDNIVNKLNSLGIETDRKIILYAPTWKGNLYNQLEYNVDEFKDIVNKLSEGIDTNHYRIYLRVHYFLYKILATDKELKKILIPFTIDTNELLTVVDVLISDYSSIFFDFLATNRPILFYVPDLEEYESGRGLYVPISELPGLVSAHINDIVNALHSICSDNSYMEYYKEKYIKIKDWCIYNDDGFSCRRIVDFIFKSNRDFSKYNNSNLKVIPNLLTGKKRHLYCINSKYLSHSDFDKFKSVFENIDYDNVDATLLITSFKDESLKKYYNQLPAGLRILVWYGLPFSLKQTEDYWKKEIVRALGYTHFHKVIPLGEITEYWAKFFNKTNKL